MFGELMPEAAIARALHLAATAQAPRTSAQNASVIPANGVGIPA